ncbi:hypothetical protein P7K49_012834, partial [Saguinus oedipus]
SFLWNSPCRDTKERRPGQRAQAGRRGGYTHAPRPRPRRPAGAAQTSSPRSAPAALAGGGETPNLAQARGHRTARDVPGSRGGVEGGETAALPGRSDAASASQTPPGKQRMLSPGAAEPRSCRAGAPHVSAVARACACGHGAASPLCSRAFKEPGARSRPARPRAPLHVTSPAPAPPPSLPRGPASRRPAGELQAGVRAGDPRLGALRAPPPAVSTERALRLAPPARPEAAQGRALPVPSAPAPALSQKLRRAITWEKAGKILGASPPGLPPRDGDGDQTAPRKPPPPAFREPGCALRSLPGASPQPASAPSEVLRPPVGAEGGRQCVMGFPAVT